MTTVPVLEPLPSQPLARLRLAPHSALPRRIDGAWWPHSRDLLAELPLLIGALPRTWGQITGVTVNTAMWAASPGRMLVANHVVRLSRSAGSHGRHTVCLVSPGRGRWDLLVVPPEVDAADAEPLMAAAAAGLRPSH
ncbi:hypothetical protein QF035_005514 [Streptomyces umbrinus]|uniref:Uncharacterized protein n=1 Tax=Streptomyces umbrinus TaxID=67370 RepID=A0ABU0SWJ9_9ACTN|nr:DUF5994 family protein [Streptomyces umbrinus]MDQ1027932.1 hypothetical protein [Streptomyces umbrinus]